MKTKSVTDWVRDIRNNQIIPNVAENVEIFFEYLGVELRWNAWLEIAEVRGFNWPDWTYLDDFVHGALWMEAHHDRIRFNVSKEFLWAGLIALARENSVDPALEELNRLEKSWDGQYRLFTWLTIAVGTPCDLYHQAVGHMILGNMVRRIREPGCKADYVAVFWDGEGTNKSKLIQAIAPRPQWFTDRVMLGEEGKELVKLLAGKAVVEFSEMAVRGQKEIEHVKAMVSAQVDEGRAAYDRQLLSAPVAMCLSARRTRSR